MTFYAPTGFGAAAPPLVTAPTKLTEGLREISAAINSTVQAYYGTKADIARAKADAAIAAAQGRASIATATVGLPSPGILLLGGGALLAVMLLAGRRR